MGLDLRDFICNIYFFYYFVEYCIVKVVLVMVEEGVICYVDEELIGGVILIGGMCYCDGVVGVVQVVVCFIFDWWVRLFLLYLFVKVVVLYYEFWDYVVKGGVVVEVVVDVFQEVIYGNWGFLVV